MNDLVGVVFALFTLWVIARIIGGASREGRSLGRNTEQMQQMVGVVKSMFPHVPEASIRYDLMVSGSAEVTCDKILQQGYLPPPPDGFPGADEAQRPAVEEPVQQSTETEPPTAPANLITRYRLEGRLADTDTSSAISTAWSDNANDRQKSLEERKAQMILQARRRMAQRQNQQGPASAAPITPL
ncbi:Uncharacterized protein MSYG_3680 [Malassezia sympodialis ATCC 42132]|uniref:CUE domain-containing protein n=1 Tax=Malassezia sympodialis (strain ATCC 42132) TaxID=1230383 RepID=A0A1M8AA64_MALS4|nr:Uncharacterized protein MSYG_3680 [Malassezia sympodialis ATCC 42132]